MPLRLEADKRTNELSADERRPGRPRTLELRVWALRDGCRAVCLLPAVPPEIWRLGRRYGAARRNWVRHKSSIALLDVAVTTWCVCVCVNVSLVWEAYEDGGI